MAKRKRGEPINDLPLEEQYRILAARADKRLQRLEKYSKRQGMGELLNVAYKRAMLDIESWSGEGHKRFGTKPPASEFALRAKINDILTFLRADTSTLKPGLDTRGAAIAVYEQQAKKFNQRYGGDFTWVELANYYGSKMAQRIQASLQASKTIARALGEFKKLHERDPELTGAQLRRDIKSNPNIFLSDDETVNTVMKRMINMGISPRTIFK